MAACGGFLGKDQTLRRAGVKGFPSIWKINFKKASKCFFQPRVLGYYVGQGSCMAPAPSPRLGTRAGILKGRQTPGTLKASRHSFSHLSLCPVRAAGSGFFEEAAYALCQMGWSCVAKPLCCAAGVPGLSPVHLDARPRRRPVLTRTQAPHRRGFFCP
ncbi:hypothetical protein D3C75_961170 [compost metagenome]